jgi:RimJ/RimL family protein N-acetyltransferase
LVGYWTGKVFWGKGIASHALTEFLGIVKVRPLIAFVAKHDAASIRLLEKNGFRKLGEETEELLFQLT